MKVRIKYLTEGDKFDIKKENILFVKEDEHSKYFQFMIVYLE